MQISKEEVDDAATASRAIIRKYPTVDFNSNILSKQTIVEIVLLSKVRTGEIQRQLRQHPYFTQAKDMASWRALWLSFEIAAEEHDELVRRFEADFDNRVFRNESEVYHLIGLSLWLSEMDFPNWKASIVMEKVKNYIIDVYIGAAQPSEMRGSSLDGMLGGAFGLGYRKIQHPLFRDLANFHSQQRTAWQHRAYPAIAADLQRRMTENSDEFLRDVCFTSGGAASFARLGVLKHITADQFASTIVNASYRDQREVLMALSIRYQQVAAEPELADEVPWLNDVQRQLDDHCKDLPRLARSNLSELTKEYLDKTISEVNARLTPKLASSVIIADAGGTPSAVET